MAIYLTFIQVHTYNLNRAINSPLLLGLIHSQGRKMDVHRVCTIHGRHILLQPTYENLQHDLGPSLCFLPPKDLSLEEAPQGFVKHWLCDSISTGKAECGLT